MPSAAVFVNSNLSLASVNTNEKSSVKYTLEESKHGKRFTKMLALTSVSVVVSSAIPAGYNIGVMNSPREVIEAFCNQTILDNYGLTLSSIHLNLLWSVVVSIFLVGGMFGSLMAAWLCNTFGRKRAILMVNLLGLISAILFACCKVASSVEMLILARMLVGVFSGFSMSAIPMYLMEVSPSNFSGPLGVLQPLGMTFGIVIALILGLNSILGTVWAWPYLLSLFAIPIVCASGFLVLCPESPKYLFIVKGRSEEAVKGAYVDFKFKVDLKRLL